MYYNTIYSIHNIWYLHKYIATVQNRAGALPIPDILMLARLRGCFVRTQPIFVLRIFKFGVRAKQILKRKRWIFLARRLIS